MMGKEKEEEKYLNAESPNLTPLSSTRDTQKDCSSYLDVGCVEDSRAPSSSPEAWKTSSSSPSTCTASQPSYKGQEENISPDSEKGVQLGAMFWV